MSTAADPLVGPVPAEVPLPDAPLVRVIAQLRFPQVLSVEQPDFVAPFQNAIRATYPVLRREQTQTVVFGPAGVSTPPSPQTAWRFHDGAAHFRVSLTQDFLALETTKYTSRNDFFGRLRALVDALGDHVEPAQIDRVGVRYIDRLTGEALTELRTLVRPEVCGIAGTEAAAHAGHMLSVSSFDVGEAQVLARWGLVPANVSFDPAAIEPVGEKSWLLDLDMFSAAPMPFAAEQVVRRAEGYAERLYAVFRWAVTEAFLARYGGKP